MFLGVDFLTYLVSAFFIALSLRSGSQVHLRLGRWFLLFAMALHWGFLVTYFRRQPQWVPANSWESLLAISGFLSVCVGLLSLKSNRLFLVIFGEALISFTLILLVLWTSEQVGQELPSPWIWTHIVLALMGEGFLLLSSVISAGYLISELQLRRKTIWFLWSRLPSLENLDSALGECLLAGFVLLTVGLLLGVFFAGTYWGQGWHLDPKVLLAFLGWFLYALILALRSFVPSFKGRKSALFSLFGFCFVLFLSFGMDLVVPSQHHLGSSKVEERETLDPRN